MRGEGDEMKAESGKSSNRSCRVLVIEDHDDTRLLLEMMMQAEGFETSTCILQMIPGEIATERWRL